MHKISQQTAQAAEKHALASQKHRKSVEELGKALQEGEHPDIELGKRIEAQGKSIQKQAQETYFKAEKIPEEGYSTEAYLEYSQGQIEAAQTHIEAVKAYQEALAARLHKSNNSQKPGEKIESSQANI